MHAVVGYCLLIMLFKFYTENKSHTFDDQPPNLSTIVSANEPGVGVTPRVCVRAGVERGESEWT